MLLIEKKGAVLVVLKQTQEQLQQMAHSVGQILKGTVKALEVISEMRDPYTAGHQYRVAELTVPITERLGLDEDEATAVYIAARLHDIGKLYIPSDILTKPSKLSEPEFLIIKSHSEAGYEILRYIDFPWPVAETVLQHHERLDGSGYPYGLKGGEISLAARIIGVADALEAMISHRPYRPALPIAQVVAELTENKGILYDPDVVDACLDLIARQGALEKILMTKEERTGEVAYSSLRKNY